MQHMKTHHFLLASLLLIMIGIGLGIMIMMVQLDLRPTAYPIKIEVTEVKRSMQPAEWSINEIPAPINVREIVDAVIPTVVYIESSFPTRRNDLPDDGNHDFDDPFWDRFLPRGRSSSIGSGVIFSPDGFIITNNHVVGSDRNLRVTLHDKREFDAVVVGRDPSTDLAVIKIDAQDLPHAVLGNSDYLHIGDWVMAVGNPLRLRSTVTSGIVSALGRDVQIINDRMRIEHFIQTDAAINRGNSGGALVNTSGELIGINTAIATESGSHQGYGFAIPINMAFKIAGDLMLFGEVQRAFLGVQIGSVNQQRANELGMPKISGVEILETVRDGAAQKSGLRRNDVVLTINDVPVNESNALQAKIALYRPGDLINLKIWRNGRELQKEVLLAGLDNPAISEWATREPWEALRTPEEDEEEMPEADSEITLRFFHEGFAAAEFARDTEAGMFDLVVTNVLEESSAYIAGLSEGDIIQSVNGVNVESLESLKAQFENNPMGQSIEMEIIRGDEYLSIVIEHE